MSKLFPHHRGQMSEAFRTVMFLSASGGLQDAYTYIGRGKVFANAQTGNIVLMSQSLFDGDLSRFAHYFIPVLSFALGVAAAECIRLRWRQARRIHWRQLVVLAEIVLLFAVGFFPAGWDIGANALVSFACAMQVQAFRKVHGYPFASTMCIGNLRSGMDALVAFGHSHDKKRSVEVPALLCHYLYLCAGCGHRHTVRRHLRREDDLAFLRAAAGEPVLYVYQRGSAGDRGEPEKITRLPCRNGCRGRTCPPGNTVAAVRPRGGVKTPPCDFYFS